MTGFSESSTVQRAVVERLVANSASPPTPHRTDTGGVNIGAALRSPRRSPFPWSGPQGRLALMQARRRVRVLTLAGRDCRGSEIAARRRGRPVT